MSADRHPTLLSCRVDTTLWANINHFRQLRARDYKKIICIPPPPSTLSPSKREKWWYLLNYPPCFLRRNFENTCWHSVSQHRGEHECLRMMLVIDLFSRVDLVAATMCSCHFLARAVIMSDECDVIYPTLTFVEPVRKLITFFGPPCLTYWPRVKHWRSFMHCTIVCTFVSQRLSSRIRCFDHPLS